MAMGKKKSGVFLLVCHCPSGRLSPKFEQSTKILYNYHVSRYHRRFTIVVKLLWDIFKTIRPKQTLKNLSLSAPLIFSGYLFNIEKALITTWSIVIFTLLTATIYIINDIVDLPLDRLHPFKKKRPIASGSLPIPIAIFVAILCLTASFYLAYFQNFFFFLTVLAYFILQLNYSFWLKHIIILDVMAIAGGFVLRVYAGSFAINVHMNVWFLLCVVSLSLFLAVGKRRAELAILTRQAAPRHRKTLTFYTADLLNAYLAIFANSTWMAYALFTFFSIPPAINQKITFWADLPLTLAGINKWLMVTIPIVIYGVMRYMNIIYQGSRAESPENVLLSDKPLLITAFVWGIMVVGIIYGVGS
jgi:4-hydroxybenzoate polyprenyltransferase